VANLLMTKPVATVFRPVFEPKLAWLFRDSPPPKPPTPPEQAGQRTTAGA
jgi:hypothetical protein